MSGPGLLLQFTKQADGGALLRCVRADGSATWQKQRGDRAAFFPLHDLTHYAVETELGFSRGFYGLIATGWDIEETTGKGVRGPLPNEAIEVEYIVSALTAERAGGAIATDAEFNELAATFAQARGLQKPRALKDSELGRVRKRVAQLFGRWSELPSGAMLELPFKL